MTAAHPPSSRAATDTPDGGLPPRAPPLRVGTRGSALALVQTRAFMAELRRFYPALHRMDALEEHVIGTTGDAVQDRRLADIGGKGLFTKEIHEALLDRRIDAAVHSLKDLETALPDGIVLACTLKREDARDALILGPGCGRPDPAAPLACLPPGARIGTASLRRQAQLLFSRPDLAVDLIRGSVPTRLAKVEAGDFAASMLAIAGLNRLGLARHAGIVLDADVMVPSAGQGIIGITVRADDVGLREVLAAVEDPESKAASAAERSLLAELDGSCRTPIGSYAHLLPGGALHLTGLVARADGSFLLKRQVHGPAGDAARMGRELGASLRADSPHDVFT